MGNLENKLLDAIQIINKSDIEKAGYDKTITATVVECIDATIGKYKIKYQDSYFYAYYDNTNVIFKEGDIVQILIPTGDFTHSTNRIVGGNPSNNLRTAVRYNGNTDKRMYYEKLSPDCVIVRNPRTGQTAENKFVLNAMSSSDKIFFYDDSYARISLADYDRYVDSFQFYDFEKSRKVNAFIIEFDVKTDLGVLQKKKGNYGIHLVLEVVENNIRTEKEYTINADALLGNKYNFLNPTHQYAICDFPEYEGKSIGFFEEKCYLFSEGFYTDEENHGNITISNIQVFAARKLSEDEYNQGKLFINTDNLFIDSDTSTTLDAELRVKGNLVNPNAQDVKFYWFVQNTGVTKSSSGYNENGGEGWLCLNDKYVVDENYKVLKELQIDIDDDIDYWSIPENLTNKEIPRSFYNGLPSKNIFVLNEENADIYRYIYNGQNYNYYYYNDEFVQEGYDPYAAVVPITIYTEPDNLIKKNIIWENEKDYTFVNNLDIINVNFRFINNDNKIITQPYIYNSVSDSWNKYALNTNPDINGGDIVEWLPSVPTLEVDKNNAKMKKNTFKCVAIYENAIYSNTIEIINGDGLIIDICVVDEKENIINKKNSSVADEYLVETSYLHSLGRANLKCVAINMDREYESYGSKLDLSNYNLVWNKINTFGECITLKENKALIDSYKSNQSRLEEIQTEISTYTKPADAYQEELRVLGNIRQEFLKEVDLVDGDNVWNINLKAIIGITQYTCSIYDADGGYYGCAKILIKNDTDSANKYILAIKNGNRVFHYDAEGVSPLHKSKIDKSKESIISPLEIIFYDVNGAQVNVNNLESIQWKVPKNDTMISIDGNKMELGNSSYTMSEDDEYITYSITPGRNNIADVNFCYYNIANVYNSNYKNNNDIELTVKYNGLLYSTKTSFSFIKDGSDGSNGSKYTCRIVPSAAYNNINIDYSVNFFYVYNDGNDLKISYEGGREGILLNGTFPFDIEIWNNQNKIVNPSATIDWKILKRSNANSTETDDSFYKVYKDNNNDLKFATNNMTKTQLFNLLTQTGGNTYHPSNILQAIVNFNNLTYYVTIPIVTILYADNITDYNFYVKPNTGFLYVEYNSEGKYPKYNMFKSKDNIKSRFDLEAYYQSNDISNFRGSSTTPQDYQNAILNYNWVARGQLKWNNNSYLNLYADNNNEIPLSSKWVSPVGTFDGSCTNVGLFCCIKQQSTMIAVIHIPIYMYLNRYGNSAINSWDGNSILLEENGSNIILAPQIGAGVKEADNSFTGVIMGTQLSYNNNSYSKEVGLHGYSRGQRSIFLDAYTGKAEFGITDKGKVIIDPSNNTATIKGGTYLDSATNGKGLLINLGEYPEIRFGSRKFMVNSNGEITSTAGTIGGWTITSSSLHNNASGTDRITLEPGKIYSNNKTSLNSSVYGFYIGSDGISVGGSGNSSFCVNSQGHLVAQGVEISGNISSTTGTIGGWTIASNRLENGDQTVYIGTNGWKFGNNFEIDSTGAVSISGNVTVGGTINASGGSIGGWTINSTSISKSGLSLNGNTGTITGTGGWTIDSSGFTGPTITNGNFSGSVAGFTASSANGLVCGDVTDITQPSFIIRANGSAMAIRGGSGKQQFLVDEDRIIIDAKNVSLTTTVGGGNNVVTRTLEDIFLALGWVS